MSSFFSVLFVALTIHPSSRSYLWLVPQPSNDDPTSLAYMLFSQPLLNSTL